MSARYTVEATTAIALTSATAKSVLAVINAANGLIRLTEWALAFDGASASATPVLIEVGICTMAGAGTKTTQAPVQSGGPTRTVQAAGARAYSAEPTVITVLKRHYCHPQSGMLIQYPLGREIQAVVSAYALLLRCTAPAGVNVTGYMEFEEG